MHLVARSHQADVTGRLTDALKQIDGAYVCVADDMLGVRDPHGVRPLVLGKRDDTWILASETCALDIVGASYVRDLEPGEMLTIDRTGMKSQKPFQTVTSRFCVFEYLFSAPTRRSKGVYLARKAIGAELGAIADRGRPRDSRSDSGVPAALGYAEASDIPFDLGIIGNHYVGRTFFQPTQKDRRTR